MEGGGDLLSGECRRLLIGQALESGHEKELDRFPITNPVAWTKTYTGKNGIPARVFFTTLGHPYDFKQEAMRKLALTGTLWSLGMEDKIPPEGAKAETVGAYDPNNSGFGDKFKAGLRPDRANPGRFEREKPEARSSAGLSVPHCLCPGRQPDRVS